MLFSAAQADTQSVTLTTNKPSGTPLTILVNNSRAGVKVDWGNGSPQTYSAATDGIIEVKGSVAGSTITVSSERAITMLAADDCGLTDIDLTQATDMRSLYLQNNALTSINISKMADLRDLNLSNNQLTAITLSTTAHPVLETLDLSHNAFTTTSFTYGNPNLRYLNVSDNNYKTLTLTKNVALSGLKADNNNISTLNITYSPEFTMISASGNQIGRLTVPETLTTLQQLYLNDNNAKGTLDLGNNKSVNAIDVSNNSLSSVVLPTSTKLQAYSCGNNALTFSSLPRTSATPTIFFSYQPQAAFDISTLPGVQEECWGSNYLPWVSMSPGYDKRQDEAYVIDMTNLRGGSSAGSVKFAFYNVADDGTETELQQATAANKTLDFTNITGKVTFQNAYAKVVGKLTDAGYPDLIIRTLPFAVINTSAEGIDTAVDTEANTLNAPAFDIQGRQTNLQSRGLYIINNKKVLVGK